MQVLDAISVHFGDLSISRGQKYDFLGMNIKIKECKVFINMKEQVMEAIEWGKCQGGSKPPNPSTGTLFIHDEDSPSLETPDAHYFHSIVQKLLSICK